MEYTTLGNTEIQVSRLALGCWAFGGDKFWGPQDDKDSTDTVSAALDHGITFFDTAEGYGPAGRAETVLGKALQGRREKAVIATKVAGGNLAEDKVVLACEKSLDRLETDYIDLYYIHWPNPNIPIEETVRSLERLVKSGKVRCLGISNFGPKFLKALEATGKIDLFTVNQLPYNLLWRAIEHAVLPETIALGLGIVPYSSLAQGLLTGAYSSVDEIPDYLKITRFYDAKHIGADHGESGCEDEVFAAVNALKAVARREKVSLPELSLAWLLAKGEVTSILSGARTPAEISQNVGVMDANLSPGVLAEAETLTEDVKVKIGANPDMWMGGENTRYA